LLSYGLACNSCLTFRTNWYQNRGARAKQLDEGIVDTFALVEGFGE
jgi:hypothetical protein